MALRQLRRRLGIVSAKTSRRVKGLGIKRLERLTEDLLDFTTLADLDRWLDGRH